MTGGSSGIGLAVARLFIAEGATVFVTGRRQPEIDTAVAELGPLAIGIRGDIARLEDLDLLFATIQKTHPRIDILFANAGIGEFVPLDMVTEDHFDKTFAVNAKGTFFTVQKALRLMPNGSTIILNASIGASQGFPAFSVYAGSKAAIRSYAAQSTAIPLGRVGQPEEVAKAVLFLASNESSYINGVELFVDGGVAQI